MRVLGISGQRQSGKDTTGDILLPHLQHLGIGQWTRLAFADAVKDVMCTTLGVSREWIEEWKVKDEIPRGWGMNCRQALINIGDRFREIDENCWLDKTMRHRAENKLITDVRYKNEAREIRENGLLIRIHKPGNKTINNKSETDLLKYDEICLSSGIDGEINIKSVPYNFFVINSGSIQDLTQKVEDLVLPGLERSLKFFV